MANKLALAAVVLGASGLAVGGAHLTLAQAPSGLDSAAIEQASCLKGTLIAARSQECIWPSPALMIHPNASHSGVTKPPCDAHLQPVYASS